MTRAKNSRPGDRKRLRTGPTGPERSLRRLHWSTWLLVGLAVAGAAVLVHSQLPAWPHGRSPGPPRAAIVDQLYNLQPNPAFISGVTGELEQYGFQVHLHQGDDIDVDFYRDLPTHGYRLIVLRVHSGLLGEGEQAHTPTLLFTNEEYSPRRHEFEQVSGRLAYGVPGPGQPGLFGIAPTFVTHSMKGTFDDTVVVLMGCGAIYLEDMAAAFIQKGASAYIAWDLSVLLHYVDEATPYLIRQLCSEGATIQQAVDRTMSAFGPDPKYEAQLMYYPSEIGDKTVEELARIEFPAEDDTTAPPADHD